MNHLRALRCLPVAGTGTLDPAEERALEQHVAQCSVCRRWLATRDLLASGLGRDAGGDHPDSELLALCAVRPHEADEPDREDLRHHLGTCAACRRVVERVAMAVREARPPGGCPVRGTEGSAGGRWLGWSVAAALLLALLGGVLLDRSLRHSVPERPAETQDMAVLSGEDLDGTQVIERDRSLVVSRVTVRSGADVTLCAGPVVAFGDGFRVAEGARLQVGPRPASGADHRFPCRRAGEPERSISIEGETR